MINVYVTFLKAWITFVAFWFGVYVVLGDFVHVPKLLLQDSLLQLPFALLSACHLMSCNYWEVTFELIDDNVWIVLNWIIFPLSEYVT